MARQDADTPDEEMIGTSPAIRQVFSSIRKVATTDVPVLLVGESGTGKELTAKAIHERSARKDGPFIPINCGAIPETLLEAELFGYEKGAFTGAVHARKGKLEYAQRGTLFLDEVGEMSLALQVKLLRFLQDRTIERVGGRQTIEVDARVVAATNVDLRRALEAGTFREDLFYRLSVVTIALPPLRERGEDPVLIAQIFFKRLCEQMHKRLKGFTKEAIRAIETYPWPGNVRELSNKIRRAVAMTDGAYITPEDLDLPWDGTQASRTLSLREARDRLEAEMVAQALARHDGNLSRVAEELKISRPTLYALLRKHRIRERRSPVIGRRQEGAAGA
jgi:two-component system NtrC family response regulator